jgi:RNA-binding protein
MTSKERAALRAEANTLEPIMQIGKEGVTPAVVQQALDNFNTRELFKIRVHLESSPVTPREVGEDLAAKTGCEVVQTIGGVLVVFKINPELRRKEAEKKQRAREQAREAARAARAARARKRI